MSAQYIAFSDFCTLLKPLQSSSPCEAGTNLGAFAATAAAAGTPLVQATPSNNAIALITPRSTLDLGLCTCDRPLTVLRLSDTGGYGTKSFILHPTASP